MLNNTIRNPGMNFYNSLVNIISDDNKECNNLRQFAVLRIAVKNQPLFDKYLLQAMNHNNDMLTNPFPNSGFDLFIPENVTFPAQVDSKFIDLQVKAEMIYCDLDLQINQYCGYLIHPRSSISKTPLHLANNTGIIDSGYRGSLIVALRNLDTYSFDLEQYTRVSQVCHPSLCPILVELIQEKDLSSTLRGEGGFGSTGR